MKSIIVIVLMVLFNSCNTKPHVTSANTNRMKTVVLYASNHGTTEKVAKIIREKLDSTTTEIINLNKINKVDLSNYENIVIGASIHAGGIQSEVKKFIKENTIAIMQKKLALYLCCMNEAEEKKEFDTNYPELLRNHSKYNAIVGGEYIFEKMNFIEKFLVRKIAGATSTVSKLRYNEIDNLVKSIKNE